MKNWVFISLGDWFTLAEGCNSLCSCRELFALWWWFDAACPILRDGLIMLWSSFEMENSASDPSFEMALLDFWLTSFLGEREFYLWKHLPPPKLLFLWGFIVLMWRSLWEEGCNIVRKRLPPPLQSCSKDFGSLYFVLAEGFLACLLCTLIFSRRFLGFDSCFESTAPWLSWCIAYTLIFCRWFVGFDSCFESTAPWLS